MRILLGFGLIAAAMAAIDFKNLSKDLSTHALHLLRATPSPINYLTTMKDLHFAAKLLKSLNISGLEAQCSTSCEHILTAFKQATNSIDLYYAYSAATTCGCSGVKFSAKSFIIIDEDLEKDELSPLCGAALAAKSANKSDDLTAVFAKIKSLMKSDGTFKHSPSMSASCTANTRLVLAVITEYASQWPPAALAEILDTVMQLLPEGDDDLAVEPTLFAHLMSVSEKKSSISAARLELIVENLLNLVYSRDISIVADSVESLKAVTNFKTQPVFLSIAKARFSTQDDIVLTLFSKSAIGDEIPVESGVIKSIKKVGKESNLHEGPLSQSVSGLFSDLSSLNLSPGRYEVQFSIQVEGRSKSIQYEDYFTVMSSYEIDRVHIGVGNNKKTVANEAFPVSEQLGLHTSIKGSAQNIDYVYVSFAVSSPLVTDKLRFIKPHQVFVRFTNIATGKSVVYLSSWDGKLEDKVGGKYYNIVSLADESNTFGYTGGEFSVSILVADFIAPATEWTIGNIALEFNTPPKKDVPLYVKSLLDTSDKTLTPLPEIAHKMRPPAKKASWIMSITFTLIAMVPLALLVRYMLSLKLNMNKLNNSTNYMFVGCVFCILVVYVGYWLALRGLSFYNTIKYIAFLAPVTYLVGRSALSAK